jgi:hypothetical protein
LPYHYDPQDYSSETGERLEEPVGDGGLVVRGEVELVGQAVQVFNWLSSHVIKVNLKSSNYLHYHKWGFKAILPPFWTFSQDELFLVLTILTLE